MNLFPADSAYGRANGRREDFVRGKVYKWDLTGLLGVTAGQVAREKPGFGIPSGTGGGNVRGTIEFRQPPGSLTANEAVGGIEVAVSFVAGALMVGSIVERGREVLDAGGPREELWALLASGAKMLG